MAGRIPQHFIDQLLNRIDIVDLIDGYVPLKKAGGNYKACCPFHNEKTPSFTVSPSKQFYHCFGCGENGTAISFLMRYDHMEFREAIEKLAASAGMDIPEEAQGATPAPKKVEGIDLYELMEEVSEFYQQQLRKHPQRDEAVQYLKKRGLSGEIAKRFGLGFAPEGWSNLMDSLGSTTAAQKALLDTGMLTENEKKRVYDRFRHRIMFPIADHRGRIVGFGGRVLDNGEPKYLNSPETPIFHKGSELYGLFAARGPIKDADAVLVVEGYMDVVALAQAGINNAVATLGTATTPMHLQRLFRHTPNIVFSFDGDRAGKAAAWKALQTCLPLMEDGRQIGFLFLPDGEDPDSMVNKVGQEAFLQLVQEATPLPDFLIDTLQKQADLNRLDGRAKLIRLAKPLLSAFPNGVLKKLVADRLARLAQLAPADLLGSASSPSAVTTQPTNATQPGTHSINKHAALHMTKVRRAISLLLQYPQFAERFRQLTEIPPDKMRGLELVHELYDTCSKNPEIRTAALLERYREQAYFNTLRQLALHHHNDMEWLSDEQATDLIDSVCRRIFEEYRSNASQMVLQELETLNQLASTTSLSNEQLQRKEQLSQMLRTLLKTGVKNP